MMVVFGIIGNKRVKNADDYATARGGYGPLFLALAFTSTAASGATFLGMPALSYHFGLSSMWFMFVYPCGLYAGVLICQHAVARAGTNFGARSIPEYLGEKYQSDVIRVMTSVYTLILLFYLASQLVSGLVMFEVMLGLSQAAALIITTAVLLGYVVMGRGSCRRVHRRSSGVHHAPAVACHAGDVSGGIRRRRRTFRSFGTNRIPRCQNGDDVQSSVTGDGQCMACRCIFHFLHSSRFVAPCRQQSCGL